MPKTSHSPEITATLPSGPLGFRGFWRGLPSALRPAHFTGSNIFFVIRTPCHVDLERAAAPTLLRAPRLRFERQRTQFLDTVCRPGQQAAECGVGKECASM